MFLIIEVRGVGRSAPPAAAGPAPTPEPVAVQGGWPAVYSGMGYGFVNVPTSFGTFGVHLIKEPLSMVTVRTVTANVTDSANDCPAKPLVQDVSENTAYAGMTGTYLCPPDYPSCAAKVNSYDYAVYNSNLRKWLNAPARVGQNGLVTFSGSTATFYRRSYFYAQGSAAQQPIMAAITMFPCSCRTARWSTRRPSRPQRRCAGARRAPSGRTASMSSWHRSPARRSPSPRTSSRPSA